MFQPNFCGFKKIIIHNLLPKNQARGQGQVFQRVFFGFIYYFSYNFFHT